MISQYKISQIIHDEKFKIAYEKERCKRSFFYFLQTFWDLIIKEPPIYNWHIEYLCSELQILSESIIKREKKPYDLIINIPPGTTKSTITTIMYPAWLWIKDPSIRIITNSYSMNLSIEHATKSRDIIISEQYRRLFPYVQIRRDMSQKTSYENTLTGARYTTSTGGTITGKHAHIIINDDPLNPGQSTSALEIYAANEHTKTLSTRKVNKANTPTILIMQRLHENDVTGYILDKKGQSIKHINLPAEISETIKPIELKEKYINGKLDPIRLSDAVLDEARIDLGSRAYAGQYEQEPQEDGGNIIKYDWFKTITPDDFIKMQGNVQSTVTFFCDTAYTNQTWNDPTGIIATTKLGNDLYIIHAKKVNYKFPDLIRFMPEYVIEHGYTNESAIRIEPKANGLSVIDQLQETTHLNITKTPTPTEDKETRLNAASPSVECGRVILVAGQWNEEFITEICGFPNKTHDEYVDLLCYAVQHHLKPNSAKIDLSTLYKNLY
jgi:predicted phage terminase large subunit-like protein